MRFFAKGLCKLWSRQMFASWNLLHEMVNCGGHCDKPLSSSQEDLLPQLLEGLLAGSFPLSASTRIAPTIDSHLTQDNAPFVLSFIQWLIDIIMGIFERAILAPKFSLGWANTNIESIPALLPHPSFTFETIYLSTSMYGVGRTAHLP